MLSDSLTLHPSTMQLEKGEKGRGRGQGGWRGLPCWTITTEHRRHPPAGPVLVRKYSILACNAPY